MGSENCYGTSGCRCAICCDPRTIPASPRNAPPETITIPKAEYERLLRRAEFWEALKPEEWDVALHGLRLASYEGARGALRMYILLRAAIEKQEG